MKEIEKKLKEQVDEFLKKEIKSFARWSSWAGDLGWPCDTYQALCRLKPELKPLPDLNLIKVFRTGQIIELPNLQLLQNAGIRIIEQARSYQWVEKKISGRIDAKIEIELNGKKLKIPLEHKALSPNVYRHILKHKEENIPLQKSKYPWVKKYPGQLQTYMLMEGIEYGMWFFFEKVSGQYDFWLFPFDFEYAESLLQRAERANENVEKGIIPEPERQEICKNCDFVKTYCFVGKDYGAGFDFLTDEELLNKLIRREELEAAYKEYLEIDEELKEIFRGKNVIIGDFKIISKEVERKEYTIQAGKYWRIYIEKL